MGRFGGQRGPYGALAGIRGSDGSGRSGLGTGMGVGLGEGDPDVWEDEFGEDCFGDEGAEGDDERWWWERWVLRPKRKDVRVIVRSWWRKVGVLMVLPAAVVSLYMSPITEELRLWRYSG